VCFIPATVIFSLPLKVLEWHITTFGS
jgi:hypothetical protein